MPQRSSKSISPSKLSADRTALRALKLLADYVPSNPALSKESVGAIEAQLTLAEDHEFQIEMALAAARSDRVARAWELHEAMLRVKAAVVSQYGHDSDEMEALGLKKKADYRRPSRRGPPDRTE